MPASEPLFLNRPGWRVRVGCLTLAVIAGSLAGHWWAMRMPAMYGGQRVHLTTFGEVFFSVIGAVGGFVAAFALLHLLRSYRPQWQLSFTAAVMSGIVGLAAGPAVIVALNVVFFTIPFDLFALLFDISTFEK
jgi:hypothetical protein